VFSVKRNRNGFAAFGKIPAVACSSRFSETSFLVAPLKPADAYADQCGEYYKNGQVMPQRPAQELIQKQCQYGTRNTVQQNAH
jgi:hypothetical protein